MLRKLLLSVGFACLMLVPAQADDACSAAKAELAEAARAMPDPFGEYPPEGPCAKPVVDWMNRSLLALDHTVSTLGEIMKACSNPDPDIAQLRSELLTQYDIYWSGYAVCGIEPPPTVHGPDRG